MCVDSRLRIGDYGNLTQRIQVLFSPLQFQELRRIANARGESVAQLIRRAGEQSYFVKERQWGIDAVQRMAAVNMPVADWEHMERESVEP